MIIAAVTLPVEVRLPFTIALLMVALTVLIDAAVILPVTVNALKLFRLVMLANVPADSVPLKVPPVIIPGTVKLLMNALPVTVRLFTAAPFVTDKVLVVVLPDTVIAVRPPNVVMLF